MRRADRLFQIIQYLRTRSVTTALWLSEKFEVSERTIYRDVSDLQASGVPIEGEAGVGYALRKGFDFPPLMFTADELAALSLGAEIVKSWADPQLANAAESILSKVSVVLPDEIKSLMDNQRLFSPMIRLSPTVANRLAQCRLASDKMNKLRFSYTREDGEQSERVVWPLGLFFWGQTWTLGTWCEYRESFRNFRLDRMGELEVLEECYPITEGRMLSDFIESCREQK